jgi:hypothetical protein
MQIINGESISRRSFVGKSLKASAGILGVVAGSGALVTLLASCGGKSPGINYTIISSPDTSAHSHQITVLGTDLDSPPGQRVLTSTDTFLHTHALTLQKADFEAMKNGQSTTKTCTPTGTPLHTHTFVIKKP